MLLFTPLVQGLWTRTDKEIRVHVADIIDVIMTKLLHIYFLLVILFFFECFQ